MEAQVNQEKLLAESHRQNMGHRRVKELHAEVRSGALLLPPGGRGNGALPA